MGILIFGFSLHADEGHVTAELTSKAILKNESAYFVLSDGSCWKVIPFQKRWRSLSEWWYSVELDVPKNYDCVPSDWYLGAEIEIYRKYENVTVDEGNSSNQKDLNQCTHLLVNPGSGNILFAISLSLSGCLQEVYNDAHSDGYNKGYKVGWDAGYQVGYRECVSQQPRAEN